MRVPSAEVQNRMLWLSFMGRRYRKRIVAQQGLPVTVLEEYEPPLLPASLVYPRQRKAPPKQRAFLALDVRTWLFANAKV